MIKNVNSLSAICVIKWSITEQTESLDGLVLLTELHFSPLDSRLMKEETKKEISLYLDVKKQIIAQGAVENMSKNHINSYCISY